MKWMCADSRYLEYTITVGEDSARCYLKLEINVHPETIPALWVELGLGTGLSNLESLKLEGFFFFSYDSLFHGLPSLVNLRKLELLYPCAETPSYPHKVLKVILDALSFPHARENGSEAGSLLPKLRYLHTESANPFQEILPFIRARYGQAKSTTYGYPAPLETLRLENMWPKPPDVDPTILTSLRQLTEEHSIRPDIVR
ncbi:hypothetical protein FRC03_011994 [Tulasnella sp. 419]|nr:hypothetical protein FRC03_011994 [Tulasnella sp. 419]